MMSDRDRDSLRARDYQGARSPETMHPDFFAETPMTYRTGPQEGGAWVRLRVALGCRRVCHPAAIVYAT